MDGRNYTQLNPIWDYLRGLRVFTVNNPRIPIQFNWSACEIWQQIGFSAKVLDTRITSLHIA